MRRTTYFSLNDPSFHGKLQLDFAWSILGSLVLDDDKGASVPVHKGKQASAHKHT